MSKIETLEDFYQRRYDWMPDNIRKEIGHFNVFKLEPYVGENAKPVPYTKRDYFKITLLIGESKIEYADKIIELKGQALGFNEPTHFNNFFKKNVQLSPLKFRNL
ncbi:hypothetical protein SAMN05428988_4004 [Chitinophaga sp. YR573]|uniref:hypothetical protein n=1 Tax=Chitinophaga sp. YR573 TaxID=1881040 RepID=UPI0008C1C7ED|nr:hypothetical protein [Chitinophaga sp. YR573]SEW28893.1 hypothetical protein SAMN05428988_4004 [Chitinophaga sp. YR573]